MCLKGYLIVKETLQSCPLSLQCNSVMPADQHDIGCLLNSLSQVLQFLERHTDSASSSGPADRKAHLAGSSIYVDRNFLRKHMPKVHEHLHWRLIDVSSILELARRWYPEEFKKAPKKKVNPKFLEAGPQRRRHYVHPIPDSSLIVPKLPSP